MDTTTLKNTPAQVLNKDSNGVSQSLILQTENETKQQTTKNECFQALERELTGLRFDEDAMKAQLEALNLTLTAQGLPEIDIEDTIATAKAKAASEKAKELDKLSILEMWAKIQGSTTYQANKDYFPAFVDAEMMIRNAKLVIYKGTQSKDKDGNNRYTEETITQKSVTGQSISRTVYFALVDFSFLNFISAVRYYSTFDDAKNSLRREVRSLNKPYYNLMDAVRELKAAGMSAEDIKKLF